MFHIFFMMTDSCIYDTNISPFILLGAALYILVVYKPVFYNYTYSYIITSQQVYMSLRMCVCSWSVVSESLQTHGLQSARFLCPWDFPGKNTGVCCHVLLQGIFLNQRSNPHVLHWQVDSLPRNHQRSPIFRSKLC